MPKSTKKADVKSNNPKAEIKQVSLPKVTLPKINLASLKEKFNTSKLLKALIVAVLFVFSFALIDLFVQYLNNSYSVAIVNGVRVSKGEYLERLEKSYGQVAAQNLIQEQLVLQGAARENVSVTADDIQNRLNDYYNENGGKDAVLASLAERNYTEEDVREQIKIGLLLEKILSKEVTYTDEELKEFFNQYKSVLYGNEKVTFEDKKAEIIEYYTNKEIQELRDAWLEKEEQSAKVQNNTTTKPSYGFLKTTINIVKNLYSEVTKEK